MSLTLTLVKILKWKWLQHSTICSITISLDYGAFSIIFLCYLRCKRPNQPIERSVIEKVLHDSIQRLSYLLKDED